MPLHLLLRKGCALSLVFALYAAPAALSFSLPISKVEAASLTQLEREKAAALAAKKKAEAEAAKKKAAAEKAAQQINKVNTQISQVQAQLTQTQETIRSIEIDIENQNQTIAELSSELRRVQEQQDALVRYMYVLRASQTDNLAMFSDEGISKRERDKAQFAALVQSVMALYTRTTEAKMAVQQRKTDLENKNLQMNQLKEQQSEQQRGLAVYRSTQTALKTNAEVAVAKLEAEAETAGKKIANLEDQIRRELASRVANSQGFFGSGPGVGTRVRRGDYVGIQGSTGFSTGDHVHLEVNFNGPANGHTSPWPYLNNGTISWPLRSFVITQNYGTRSSWYAVGYHMGIDIAGPIGSPVFAPADGIVVLNEYFGGYGNAWAMKVDNGPYVLLGHLRK